MEAIASSSGPDFASEDVEAPNPEARTRFGGPETVGLAGDGVGTTASSGAGGLGATDASPADVAGGLDGMSAPRPRPSPDCFPMIIRRVW